MGNRRSPATSLLRFIAVGLIAFAMACTLLLIFQRVFSPFHLVKSDSMSPQIKTGDAVVVKDIDPTAVTIGQIIIFEDPEQKGQYIIHRVVTIEDAGYVRYFTTKGDANPINDPDRIATGEVVGGVAAKLSGFGVFLDFLGTPKGYVSCIAVPAGVCMVLVFVLSIVEKTASYRQRKRNAYQAQPTGST